MYRLCLSVYPCCIMYIAAKILSESDTLFLWFLQSNTHTLRSPSPQLVTLRT